MANPFAWTQNSISHGYLTTYQGPGTDSPHYAVDVATPFHTPLTALLSGTVTQADYAVWNGAPGGGEVFIKANDGRTYYYYHLDLINVKAGQKITAGQQIGLSGGQNSGGFHPVSPVWSTGPHTHVGFFSGYKTSPTGGSMPYGPDITSTILAARGGTIPGNTGTGTTTTGSGNTGTTTGSTTGTPTTTGGSDPLSQFFSGFLQGFFQIMNIPSPWQPGSSFNPFLENTGRALFSMGTTTTAILNSVPGFYGFCLALDEAEQFPGVVTCSTPSGALDFTIGNIDTGIANPFAAANSPFGDIFCTIVSTITGNAMAAGIRLLLVVLGLVLLLGLSMNITMSVGAEVGEKIGPAVGPLLEAVG